MKNKLPKYDNYKPSNVEWLGEIPQHWEVTRIKNLFKEINERSMNGNEDLLSVSQYTGVTKKGDKIEEGELLTNAATLEGYKKVFKGDLVSNIMLAWNGSLGFSEFEGITSPAYSIYRLKVEGAKNYFHYLFRTELYKSEFKRNSSGVIESRLRLYTDDFFRIPSILPPLSEQEKIAQFLDEKTTKIDKAIEIKQRQIELLKERRQILIHRAVTKGLNHDSKDLPDYHDFNNTDNPVILQSSKSRFRQSGVEWIGEIPEHWILTKVKYYSKVFVPERAKPDLNTDKDGIPWVTTEHLRNSELFEKDVTYYVSKIAAKRTGSRTIKANSVIATCVGNFGIASKLNFECIINQQVQGFTDLRINADYLTYLIGISEDYFKNNSTLTTIMYVSKDTFGCLPILFPPIEEQKAIVSHIENISAKISKAIGLKEREILVLKEYKSSLINSAVTGKVKIV
jgi:type I restriction enzyme S subunit